MNNMNNPRWLGFLLCATALTGCLVGFLIGQNTAVLEQARSPEQTTFNTRALEEALEKLKEEYLYPEKLNDENLLFGAIRGLIKESTDDYTTFFAPDEAKRFLEDTAGHFEGIGAEIGFKSGFLTIIAPLKNTPAEAAGLKAGDSIIEIDSVSTQHMTLEEAVSRIRGPAGSTVTLTIGRENEEEPKKFAITRAVINIPVLDVKRDGDIAIIELYNFSSDTSERFRAAARDLVVTPPKGIILDLRNNPGGFLDVAVDIAGYFMEPNSPVVIEHRRDREDTVLKTSGTGALADLPLVVLVNQGSASAAEILAGALADVRHVMLVGETTFGKGSIQELFDLHLGGVLKITIGEWRRPSGASIAQEGLKPDKEVIPTAQDLTDKHDVQLEAAKQILRGQ